jgi:hypothetical protein
MNTQILVGIIAILFFIFKYLLNKVILDSTFTVKQLFSDTLLIWFGTNLAFFLQEQINPFLSMEDTSSTLPEIFLTEPGF